MPGAGAAGSVDPVAPLGAGLQRRFQEPQSAEGGAGELPLFALVAQRLEHGSGGGGEQLMVIAVPRAHADRPACTPCRAAGKKGTINAAGPSLHVGRLRESASGQHNASATNTLPHCTSRHFTRSAT